MTTEARTRIRSVGLALLPFLLAASLARAQQIENYDTGTYAEIFQPNPPAVFSIVNGQGLNGTRGIQPLNTSYTINYLRKGPFDLSVPNATLEISTFFKVSKPTSTNLGVATLELGFAQDQTPTSFISPGQAGTISWWLQPKSLIDTGAGFHFDTTVYVSVYNGSTSAGFGWGVYGDTILKSNNWYKATFQISRVNSTTLSLWGTIDDYGPTGQTYLSRVETTGTSTATGSASYPFTPFTTDSTLYPALHGMSSGGLNVVDQTACSGLFSSTIGGGTVLAWGDNEFGQTNVPVAAQSGVMAIAAGHYHTLALKTNGMVVAWGLNNLGQTTVPVAAQSGVTAISAGYGHSVALKNNGTVVAWGVNSSGETDVPVGLSGVTAIAAGGNHTLALKSNGTVVAWGYNYYGQTNVPVAAQSGVTAIAAGDGHSVALKNNGTVVAWGGGFYDSGQATVPVGLSGVAAISAGDCHTVALKDDGTVLAWGAGTNDTGNTPNLGQSQVPVGLSGVRAIAAGGWHTVALKTDGTVVGWGLNYYGETTVPVAAQSGVTAIAAGTAHTVAIVKATATVTLGSLSQIYNGNARNATATTSPAGLTVNFTYNGSPNAPTLVGSYTVIGTINDPNYYGSATGTLVVILPTITTQPLSQTVNAGDTATFSVGVTGTGAQFQWRFNGTNLVGKTSSTLILNSIGTNQAGIYSVLVTVGTISLLSDPAELVVPLPGQSGSKKWQFTYGGAIDTAPALAKDGTIYVAADSALIALNPSGSQEWTLSLPGLLYGSPTVAADGTIYVGAWGAPTLYAVNPNGTLRWSLNLPDAGGFTYPPSLAEDGTILVPIGGDLIPKKLYAVNTNGTPRWSFDAGGRPSGAAVAYDGTIYIGNQDTNQFFALNPDGSARWDLMGIYNPTTPAIGADGTIYVGGFFDLQFRAFRPDGTMLWQYPTSASVVGTTAVVGTDGTIYIATIWDGKLYALNPDGTLKWVHDLGDLTYTAPAISKQGTIYTSANDKRFLAINPDGTTQWGFVTGSQDINPNEGRRSSPTIAPDGTIYFPVNQPGIGGVIFAIQGDSGPAESSWPMAYQNAQHTSRVPFAITNQPASQIVLSGSNAVFSIGVASTQTCIFQWRHNGADLPNQTNATLILPNVASDAQGVYACLVSNRSGAYVSHNASLTVTTTFTLWITKQGVNVQLSWPVAYSNYTLLGSASLTGGAWITNSSPRTISGSNITVTLPATNSRMFYRAVMP